MKRRPEGCTSYATDLDLAELDFFKHDSCEVLTKANRVVEAKFSASVRRYRRVAPTVTFCPRHARQTRCTVMNARRCESNLWKSRTLARCILELGRSSSLPRFKPSMSTKVTDARRPKLSVSLQILVYSTLAKR